MVFNTNVYVRHKYTDVWQRGTWVAPMKLLAKKSESLLYSANGSYPPWVSFLGC